MAILLATKFHRPAPPMKWVQRPRLAQRMDDGLASGRVLTLVSAAAGFGKTTCVSAWVSGLDLPVAWLSLDVEDDEPGRFLTYFIAALQKVHPAVGQEIEPLLQSGQIPLADVISASLINDLLKQESRFLLILDDLHLIQDRVILRVLERLLVGLAQASLPTLHLVLLTREDPALPLARLRANNQMTEIRAADLRFSSQEAGNFLNAAMGLCLSPSDVGVLEDRTEGWIAGLQLAALALQSLGAERAGQDASAGASAFITALSGSHRYILSYLTEEVISRQPEDIQRFLLETSILDALNGELCDAVTGRADSAALLEQLYNANLFLVPLDDSQHWYRYHHLFAGLLRDRLRGVGKEAAAELHQRASQWYARSSPDFASEAIRHALAAADYPLAVRLIESHALDMLMQWQTRAVSAWMESLPPEWAAQSPKTNLAFAWLHLMGGNHALAAPYLERLRPLFSGSQAGNLTPSLKAEWLALRAMLSSGEGRPEESLALDQEALETLPGKAGQDGAVVPGSGQNRDGYVLSMIYSGMASAYQQMHDDTRAMETYQKIIAHGRASNDLFSELMGISGLGLLALQHGRLHFAFEIASQGAERVKAAGAFPPISQAVYGELGQVYYEWHEIEHARDYFLRSVQASALSGYVDAEIYNILIQARLHQMDSDLDAAAREIEKAVQRMQVISPTAVHEEVITQQVRIALAQGRLAAAESALAGTALGRYIAGKQIETGSPAIDAVPDLDLNLTHSLGLLVICTLRILLYRALKREERGCLDAGIELATRLINASLRREYIPLSITALLLRGQMYTTRGDREAALADFARAVVLGEPEGFISAFVEEGGLVADALALMHERRELGAAQAGYVEKILSAFPQFPPFTAAAPGVLSRSEEPANGLPPPSGAPLELIEPLTSRELEVLRLMAEGLKYEEVAERLFISLNTVRTYVKEIYSKLGVNSRARAVSLARQHRLL